MSVPEPDLILLAQVIGAAVVVIGPLWAAGTWFEHRLAKKADKIEWEKMNAKHFEHIEKLYENAEADRKLTRDLHDSAMRAINESQQTIIAAITRLN